MNKESVGINSFFLSKRYQNFNSTERADWPNSPANTPAYSPEKEEQKGKQQSVRCLQVFLGYFLRVLREDCHRPYLRRPCCPPRPRRTNRWTPGCFAERRLRDAPHRADSRAWGRPRQRGEQPHRPWPLRRAARRAGKGQRRSPAGAVEPGEASNREAAHQRGRARRRPGTRLPGGSSSEEKDETPGSSASRR